MAAHPEHSIDPAERAKACWAFRDHPEAARADQEAPLHALLLDPDADPGMLARAGWSIVAAAGRLPAPDADPQAIAEWLEDDGLALDLLGQTQLTTLAAEKLLAALRRWLLLGGRHAEFPRATAALITQAAHNGGAWPFAADEAALLTPDHPLTPAYLPELRTAAAASFAEPVTHAVAGQYAAWPYPVWQRILAPFPGNMITDLYRADPRTILIAGCGTGREAIRIARRAPRAQVLAVDLSAASLGYARERAGDLPNLRFEQRDLHTVEGNFDFIACSGVLMHLPDPEAGWAALERRLNPGGTMRIIVYSRIARMQVQAARARIADQIAMPDTPERIRAVRAALIALGDPITHSPDFYTMGGVRDLLLHEKEDNFDFPRIARNLDALGLELRHVVPPPGYEGDPRDLAALAAYERRNPRAFGRMIELRARKPLAQGISG